MTAIETVLVLREGHPDKWVRINKDKLKPDDVVYGQEQKTVTPARKRATVRRTKTK
jgi:hypothetical protein